MKTLLRWLKSTWLAAALILVVVLLSLIGIFLPQIPAAFSVSPDGYAWWVQNAAYDELGDIAYSLAPLGFFHIFRSVWFLGAVALLMLSILACTAQRISSLRILTRKTDIRRNDDFYEPGTNSFSIETTSPIGLLAEKAEKALKDCRYSAIREDTQEAVYFAGDRRRMTPWGTLLVHLSLLLLLAGVIAGALFGFREESFTVAEGTSREIGYGTGLTLYLDSFTDEYWADGTPKDYRSAAALYQDGKLVKSGTIRVNHPLTYRGIRIHQGSFGPAALLTVTDGSGNVLLQNTVVLASVSASDSLGRPEGQIAFAQNAFVAVLLGSAGSGDPYIKTGQIGLELYDTDMNFIGWLLLDPNVPQQLGGLTFTCNNRQFSGFMVSKTPGDPLIWAAAVLFLAGLGMIFYFPSRRLWMKLQTVSGETVCLALKLEAQREPDLAVESRRILRAMGLKEVRGGNERES